MTQSHRMDMRMNRSSGIWFRSGMGLLLVSTVWGCGTLIEKRTDALEQKRPPTANQSETVQFLQRQLRERDKRIAELTSQLEALKAIDQDAGERRKSSRSPATLTRP